MRDDSCGLFAVVDVLLVTSVALTPHAPQTQLYAGFESFVTLNFTLSNLGLTDIPKSEMGRPLFWLQVWSAYDTARSTSSELMTQPAVQVVNLWHGPQYK